MERAKAQKASSQEHWGSDKMGLIRFSDLHCREVINLCDGARLGEVCDLVFDPVCGQSPPLLCQGRGACWGCFHGRIRKFRGNASKRWEKIIFW